MQHYSKEPSFSGSFQRVQRQKTCISSVIFTLVKSSEDEGLLKMQKSSIAADEAWWKRMCKWGDADGVSSSRQLSQVKRMCAQPGAAGRSQRQKPWLKPWV